jgi:hypothetical protein
MADLRLIPAQQADMDVAGFGSHRFESALNSKAAPAAPADMDATGLGAHRFDTALGAAPELVRQSTPSQPGAPSRSNSISQPGAPEAAAAAAPAEEAVVVEGSDVAQVQGVLEKRSVSFLKFGDMVGEAYSKYRNTSQNHWLVKDAVGILFCIGVVLYYCTIAPMILDLAVSAVIEFVKYLADKWKNREVVQLAPKPPKPLDVSETGFEGDAKIRFASQNLSNGSGKTEADFAKHHKLGQYVPGEFPRNALKAAPVAAPEAAPVAAPEAAPVAAPVVAAEPAAPVVPQAPEIDTYQLHRGIKAIAVADVEMAKALMELRSFDNAALAAVRQAYALRETIQVVGLGEEAQEQIGRAVKNLQKARKDLGVAFAQRTVERGYAASLKDLNEALGDDALALGKKLKGSEVKINDLIIRGNQVELKPIAIEGQALSKNVIAALDGSVVDVTDAVMILVRARFDRKVAVDYTGAHDEFDAQVKRTADEKALHEEAEAVLRGQIAGQYAPGTEKFPTLVKSAVEALLKGKDVSQVSDEQIEVISLRSLLVTGDKPVLADAIRAEINGLKAKKAAEERAVRKAEVEKQVAKLPRLSVDLLKLEVNMQKQLEDLLVQLHRRLAAQAIEKNDSVGQLFHIETIKKLDDQQFEGVLGNADEMARDAKAKQQLLEQGLAVLQELHVQRTKAIETILANAEEFPEVKLGEIRPGTIVAKKIAGLVMEVDQLKSKLAGIVVEASKDDESSDSGYSSDEFEKFSTPQRIPSPAPSQASTATAASAPAVMQTVSEQSDAVSDTASVASAPTVDGPVPMLPANEPVEVDEDLLRLAIMQLQLEIAIRNALAPVIAAEEDELDLQALPTLQAPVGVRRPSPLTIEEIEEKVNS